MPLLGVALFGVTTLFIISKANCENDSGYNNVAYHSKLSGNESKTDTTISADASKEFDVTMIRVGEPYSGGLKIW